MNFIVTTNINVVKKKHTFGKLLNFFMCADRCANRGKIGGGSASVVVEKYEKN